jgi:hypothetical protein
MELLHPTDNVQPYHIIIVIHVKILNSSILWNVTHCSPVKADRRFGGTYLLHLQGRKETNMKWKANRAASSMRHVGFLLGLLFYSENNLPKRRLPFTGVHGAISQETELFSHCCENLKSITQNCLYV